MKSVMVLKTIFAATVVLGLAACQPKKDDESSVPVSGNISSDGQSITSSSALNGQVFDLVISQIMMDQFFNSGNFQNQAVGNLRIFIAITGAPPRQLFLRPTIANVNGAIPNDMFNIDYIGAFEMRSQALCDGFNCESVFVNLFMTSTFNSIQVKQVGFYFSRLNQRIMSAIEYNGPASQRLSTSAVINQLRSLAN